MIDKTQIAPILAAGATVTATAIHVVLPVIGILVGLVIADRAVNDGIDAVRDWRTRRQAAKFALAWNNE